MEVQRIVDRLDSLISMGDGVLAMREDDAVNVSLFQQWRTSSLAFLNAALGPGSVHYREFEQNCKSNWYYQAAQGVAILRAAKDDIEGGYLQKVDTFVSAEIFDDFLEMAEYLLDNGYKDPAASLTGAVLENELRRMCRDNDIPVKSDDNIGSLNQKLFQKPLYGKPQMRQISIWQAIRDSADHGKFEDYNAESVKDMLKGVRSFLAEYLK